MVDIERKERKQKQNSDEKLFDETVTTVIQTNLAFFFLSLFTTYPARSIVDKEKI